MQPQGAALPRAQIQGCPRGVEGATGRASCRERLRGSSGGGAAAASGGRVTRVTRSGKQRASKGGAAAAAGLGGGTSQDAGPKALFVKMHTTARDSVIGKHRAALECHMMYKGRLTPRGELEICCSPVQPSDDTPDPPIFAMFGRFRGGDRPGLACGVRGCASAFAATAERRPGRALRLAHRQGQGGQPAVEDGGVQLLRRGGV